MKTKQPLKSSLNKKISTYSALIGSAAFSFNANADIIYTDVNPDSTLIMNGDTFSIDLNGDATIDFHLYVKKNIMTGGPSYRFYDIFVKAVQTNVNSILGYKGDGSSVFVLSKGNPVDNAQGWATNFYPSSFGMNLAYLDSYAGYYKGGDWLGVQDKYMGLRLIIATDTIFGWTRLSVGDTAEYVTIKDYAFENIPNRPIKVGDIQTDKVTNVAVSDIADNTNAGDILLSFNKIANESKVSGYFAIVVKTADAASFNLDAANAAYSASNGFNIAKTGSNISLTLGTSTVDKDGNSLAGNVGYKVFVLSIADGSIVNVNHLSAASNEVFLRKYPMSGTIYLGDNSTKVTNGDVVLFRKTSVAAPAVVAGQTAINGTGNYSFAGVLPGTYVLLAVPDSAAYPDAFPTYHNSTIKWFEGTEIIGGNDTLIADITVKVAPADTTATGTVKGKLLRGDYDGTLKVMGPGDPLGGVDVNLVDKSTSAPVAHSATTDENGEFTFNNVPDGNFLLHVDIAGIPIDTNFVISVSSGDVNKSYVKIKVDSSYISFEDSVISYIISRKGDFAIKIHPNPSEGNARLNYKLNTNSDVEIAIYDINGKRINALLNQKQQVAGIYEIDIASGTTRLPAGTYILNIKIAGTIVSEKWIVSE